jgi:hypothetical protein
LTIALLLVVTPVYAKKADSTMNGGGQIVDGEYKVSFGGNVKKVGERTYKGQMQVNFHNVGNPEVDRGKFHSTKITKANWYDPNGGTCTAAMNVYMDGKFNGEDGWRLIFRAGDNDDTVRFELFDGGDKVYDTYTDGFDGGSSCVGSARTELDRGNVKIGL